MRNRTAADGGAPIGFEDHGIAQGQCRGHRAVRTFDRLHPFGWLGALADVAPSCDELSERMTLPGWEPKQGPIIDKSLTPMRSFVTEPMSHGRLYLAGDAAHIVPPTGAKGLNLALNDVSLPAQTFIALYTHGDHEPLQEYSNTALRRVWCA